MTASASKDWIFVRHGQTDWNREGRIQGGTEIPLNERGRAQARANGRKLAGLELPGDVPFFVSPMDRAQETARLVRAEMGLALDEFTTIPALRELTFGDWEGRTLVEVWTADPDPVEARKDDKWNYVPPDGESYAQLSERVAPVLKTLPVQAVIVSHGGVMRTVIQRFTGLAQDEAAILEIHQDRFWRWNGERGTWV